MKKNVSKKFADGMKLGREHSIKKMEAMESIIIWFNLLVEHKE